MELIATILTGAAVGWAAFALLRVNEARGKLVSMGLGAAGAVLGEKLLSPVFFVAPPDALSLAAFFLTAGAAAALVALSDLVYTHFGV